MRKPIILLVTLSLILISGCSTQNEQKRITGETSDFQDSTILYLEDTENQVFIDTTYIIDNEFQFSVATMEPTRFSILTDFNDPNTFEYLDFWVEDNNITIKASKGNFRYADISGSKIQDVSSVLRSRKKPIEMKLDSLQKEFMVTDRGDSEKYAQLVMMQTTIFTKLLTEDTLFVRDYPDNLQSAYILSYTMKQLPKEATRSLFTDLSQEMKESKYGLRVQKFLELSRDFNIGDKAENFSLPDLGGNKVALDDFKGKYVLMEFWSAGCMPCRIENPNLLKNYKKYKENGFEIVSITLDKNRQYWEEAVAKDSMLWTTLGDLKGINGDVAITYNVQIIPKNYLIDPDGIIVDMDLRGPKLAEKLAEIYGS